MDYKSDLHSDDDFDSSNGGYGDHHGSYSNGNSRANNPNGLSKAELRKTNKPIMEKRRRARINHCLNELKSLILEAMKKDPARHTKLEKADILEMTVKHLQSVQRQQLNMAIQTDPTVVHKFKTGFVECADEVNRYISQLDGVDTGVRQRLTSHLNNCATSLEQIGSMSNFNNGYRGQLSTTTINNNNIFGVPLANPLIAAAAGTQVVNPASATATAAATIFPPLPLDLNNNHNNNAASSQGAPIQMGGVQLIPSRLPSGEFALIMPNPPAAVISAPDRLLSTTNPLQFPAAWPTPVVSGVLPPSQLLTTTTTVQPPPPPPPAAAATTLSDFTTSFRMSAFSKPLQKCQNNNNNNTSSAFTSLLHLPGAAAGVTAGAPFHQPANNMHQNSTAATSPPPSPISSAASVSSHGDESSIMHTSSDFNTPSRPATPPQDDHNVQHNFSGVFNTPSSSETSLNSSRGSVHLQQQQVTSTSGSELRGGGPIKLKRPHTEAGDSSDSSEEEPSSKKFASVEKVATPVVSDEERDSMWRPW